MLAAISSGSVLKTVRIAISKVIEHSCFFGLHLNRTVSMWMSCSFYTFWSLCLIAVILLIFVSYALFEWHAQKSRVRKLLFAIISGIIFLPHIAITFAWGCRAISHSDEMRRLITIFFGIACLVISVLSYRWWIRMIRKRILVD